MYRRKAYGIIQSAKKTTIEKIVAFWISSLGRRDCRKCALIHDPAAVQGVRDLANVRAIVNNNKGPCGVLWGLVGDL